MTSAEKLKQRSDETVQRLVQQIVKQHKFTALDVTLFPSLYSAYDKKDELRATVTGITFIPLSKAMKWGEPQRVNYTILGNSYLGTATMMPSMPAVLRGTRAEKEHVGVRERGIPKHSRM